MPTARVVRVVNVPLQGVAPAEVSHASPHSLFEQVHDLPCVLGDRLPTIANGHLVVRLAINELQAFAPITLRLVILVGLLMGQEVSNKIGLSMILLFPSAGLTFPVHRVQKFQKIDANHLDVAGCRREALFPGDLGLGRGTGGGTDGRLRCGDLGLFGSGGGRLRRSSAFFGIERGRGAIIVVVGFIVAVLVVGGSNDDGSPSSAGGATAGTKGDDGPVCCDRRERLCDRQARLCRLRCGQQWDIHIVGRLEGVQVEHRGGRRKLGKGNGVMIGLYVGSEIIKVISLAAGT